MSGKSCLVLKKRSRTPPDCLFSNLTSSVFQFLLISGIFGLLVTSDSCTYADIFMCRLSKPKAEQTGPGQGYANRQPGRGSQGPGRTSKQTLTQTRVLPRQAATAMEEDIQEDGQRTTCNVQRANVQRVRLSEAIRRSQTHTKEPSQRTRRKY